MDSEFGAGGRNWTEAGNALAVTAVTITAVVMPDRQ
jgi:hypothetical protein